MTRGVWGSMRRSGRDGMETWAGASVASNPEGIAAQSPGLRGTSYPGIGRVVQPTPTGLRPSAATPLGLMMSRGPYPG